MTAVLALGSNVGDRQAHLRAALEVLQPFAVSPVYETAPIGVLEQGDFLNAVVLVDVDAVTAWERAQRAEAAAGRERRVRWGPRTLDVDVIMASGSAPGLVLPHPRAFSRAFVLVPWLDLDGEAYLPGHGAVAELVAALDVTGVRRVDDLALQ
ncbi:MAG: 2-amino-4-hydroxy-6-hydroxymethyldihydropteridine diphosphokinase [Mycobacteriales bacterium]